MSITCNKHVCIWQETGNRREKNQSKIGKTSFLEIITGIMLIIV